MAKAKTLVAAVDVSIDGVPFAKGDRLEGVAEGTLHSMKRMGQAVEKLPEEDPGGLKDKRARDKARAEAEREAAKPSGGNAGGNKEKGGAGGDEK